MMLGSSGGGGRGQLEMWGYVNLGFFPFFCRPEMLDFSASPVSSQVPALHLVYRQFLIDRC